MSGHPMCDNTHIFVCHMARFYMLFEGIFAGRKLSNSDAFSQCQFTAQLVKAEVVLAFFV